MVKKPPDWDLEGLLQYSVSEQLEDHFGVLLSKKVFSQILEDIKRNSGMVTKRGLLHDDQIISTWDNLVQWFVRKLCNTPDGISGLSNRTSRNQRSPLHTECYEILRTHRGQEFTSSQIADRIHMHLSRDRRNQLRQLRRTLIQVCQERGGRIRRPNATKTTFSISK